MSKYFTKDTTPVGFYSAKPQGIDSVEISDELWLEMIDAQAGGKQIGCDDSGFPQIIERAAASPSELLAIAEAERAARVNAAREAISLWQTELQLGTISDDDKAQLILWIEYIKQLMALNLTSSADVEWPAIPLIPT